VGEEVERLAMARRVTLLAAASLSAALLVLAGGCVSSGDCETRAVRTSYSAVVTDSRAGARICDGTVAFASLPSRPSSSIPPCSYSRSVAAPGPIEITASRSGYVSKTVRAGSAPDPDECTDPTEIVPTVMIELDPEGEDGS
jgi:hypothetical protein